jgi:hypothetical protein
MVRVTCSLDPRASKPDLQDLTRAPVTNWSDEETNEPLIADHRNFYKVEKWSHDGQRVTELLFAGSNLDKAKRVFDRWLSTDHASA